jgi:hypothetical protein
MSISREQALSVFHQRHPAQIVRWCEITDTLPERCSIYNYPKDYWFVCFLTIYDSPFILQSSRLVAVSKNTGEIVYDDRANDEG